MAQMDLRLRQVRGRGEAGTRGLPGRLQWVSAPPALPGEHMHTRTGTLSPGLSVRCWSRALGRQVPGRCVWDGTVRTLCLAEMLCLCVRGPRWVCRGCFSTTPASRLVLHKPGLCLLYPASTWCALEPSRPTSLAPVPEGQGCLLRFTVGLRRALLVP